jgi:GMP synthase-like glutamine amidotransferase
LLENDFGRSTASTHIVGFYPAALNLELLKLRGNMVVVVQTDPIVPPGLLIELAHCSRIALRIVQLFAGDHLGELENATAVIVLGGTMSVKDVTEFPFLLPLKERIKNLVSRDMPYLGICLGGQLLAEVLGGAVHLQKCGEKGCQDIVLTESGVSDPLFAGVSRRFISFQWHSDCFEPPPGALHLARSHACPYQAFRWGTRAYGLQFHPEVTREIVLEWSEELGDGREDVIDAFTAKEASYRSMSLTILNNFFLKFSRCRPGQ